ncbi:hypothetical protein [Marinospirillum sp.]|uniref:hypothetical protein n=1 Tax=Marinospirillum sp. TaxID=2183934 RepID=UPI00286FF20C|nr:hypothetical protein [Marinospirillum sp.]
MINRPQASKLASPWTSAWNKPEDRGQRTRTGLHHDGKLAGNVEDLRDGNIQDGQTLQKGLQETANFIHPGDDQQVRITENVTTKEGQLLYGAAHEGMHLNGAGETNDPVEKPRSQMNCFWFCLLQSKTTQICCIDERANP